MSISWGQSFRLGKWKLLDIGVGMAAWHVNVLHATEYTLKMIHFMLCAFYHN